MDDGATNERDQPTGNGVPERLAYIRPALRVYGGIAALTQTVGMNGMVADGGPGAGMSKTS